MSEELTAAKSAASEVTVPCLLFSSWVTLVSVFISEYFLFLILPEAHSSKDAIDVKQGQNKSGHSKLLTPLLL